MTTSTTKGFTLVELAIVMTIIGLLIGGILKGQELIENARVTATIAQVKSYEAATSTFRDRFDALPGDMPSASTRIAGCDADCNPGTAAGQGGNSIVGTTGWGTANYAAQLTTGGGVTQPNWETQIFWTHLLLADLISGVSDAPIRTTTTPPAWGITHPSARIGGGFVVGHANAVVLPGAPTGTGPSGMVLLIVQSPTENPAQTQGLQAMTPGRAAQIDRKLDDGRPNGGYVQAYGTQASCFTTSSATTAAYNETITTKDCGLAFRIQG